MASGPATCCRSTHWPRFSSAALPPVAVVLTVSVRSLREARQVMRPAGLRAGARQPGAAERLHADDRADHVAVDVGVADGGAPNTSRQNDSIRVCTPSVERIAGGADAPRAPGRVRRAGSARRAEADRTPRASTAPARRELDQMRRDEACRAPWRFIERQRLDARVPRGACRSTWREQLLRRGRADHRADVRAQIRRDRRSRVRPSRPRASRSSVSAMSSCTNNRRSAEQRCPALQKAEATTSSTTCSGSAVESTIIALMPPVSAISGRIAPSRAASARCSVCAVRGGAGEGDAGERARGRARSAPKSRPRRQVVQRIGAERPRSCSSSTQRAPTRASAPRAWRSRRCRRRAPRSTCR